MYICIYMYIHEHIRMYLYICTVVLDLVRLVQQVHLKNITGERCRGGRGKGGVNPIYIDYIDLYMMYHTHTHAHIHIFIYIYIYVCVFTYIYIYMCVCVCMCVGVSLHANKHRFTHMCMYTTL